MLKKVQSLCAQALNYMNPVHAICTWSKIYYEWLLGSKEKLNQRRVCTDPVLAMIK